MGALHAQPSVVACGTTCAMGWPCVGPTCRVVNDNESMSDAKQVREPLLTLSTMQTPQAYCFRWLARVPAELLVAATASGGLTKVGRQCIGHSLTRDVQDPNVESNKLNVLLAVQAANSLEQIVVLVCSLFLHSHRPVEHRADSLAEILRTRRCLSVAQQTLFLVALDSTIGAHLVTLRPIFVSDLDATRLRQVVKLLVVHIKLKELEPVLECWLLVEDGPDIAVLLLAQLIDDAADPLSLVTRSAVDRLFGPHVLQVLWVQLDRRWWLRRTCAFFREPDYRRHCHDQAGSCRRIQPILSEHFVHAARARLSLPDRQAPRREACSA